MPTDICKDIKKLINSTGTKVFIYFGKKETGDDYDPEEKNYTYTNYNPIIIKAWVRTISAEKLVWQEYGLTETGALELVCESRFRNWFKSCTRITIDGFDYSAYRVGADNRVLIYERPGNLIRVILQRKG